GVSGRGRRPADGEDRVLGTAVEQAGQGRRRPRVQREPADRQGRPAFRGRRLRCGFCSGDAGSDRLDGAAPLSGTTYSRVFRYDNTSLIWSGSSLNCGMEGWPVTMPSASDSCNDSIGYFLCRSRKGGAIVSGLGDTLSTAWQREQLVTTKFF